MIIFLDIIQKLVIDFFIDNIQLIRQIMFQETIFLESNSACK
jgi:hypothetical protein